MCEKLILLKELHGLQQIMKSDWAKMHIQDLINYLEGQKYRFRQDYINFDEFYDR